MPSVPCSEHKLLKEIQLEHHKGIVILSNLPHTMLSIYPNWTSKIVAQRKTRETGLNGRETILNVRHLILQIMPSNKTGQVAFEILVPLCRWSLQFSKPLLMSILQNLYCGQRRPSCFQNSCFTLQVIATSILQTIGNVNSPKPLLRSTKFILNIQYYKQKLTTLQLQL